MPDRLDRLALLHHPAGDPLVQLRRGRRLFQVQPVPEQFAQQRVVAEPFVLTADGDHEGVGADQLLQGELAVGPVHQEVGQVPVDLLGDAGLEQEVPILRGQPLDHLTDQVVGHRPLIPRETGDATVDVGRVQGHRRQPQTRRPALGARPQHPELLLLQMNALQVEELGGLRFGEGEITGADLGELPADPQPVQAQHRVRPAQQHQPDVVRQVVDQLTEGLQHLLTGDLVEVVQHQHDRRSEFGEPRPDLACLDDAERRPPE